jgi:hypothetical protein
MHRSLSIRLQVIVDLGNAGDAQRVLLGLTPLNPRSDSPGQGHNAVRDMNHHPGGVGFRVSATSIHDIAAYVAVRAMMLLVVSR